MKKSNLFGTDGIRGTFGKFPFTINDLIIFGNALGNWIKNKYDQPQSVIIAQDTRRSCDLIKTALSINLLAQGITIFDAGIIPTPALALVVKQKNNSSCGIMISASHNPYEDNGIKIIGAQGKKISQQDEQAITALFYQEKVEPTPTTDQLGIVTPIAARNFYKDYILARFQHLSLVEKKIILDCAHGATCQCAPAIFKELGANVMIIANHPNGCNINQHCGSTYPHYLQQAVVQHNADIGFAFDGDGDRIIIVNKEGIIKNGDDILALLCQHARYRNQKTIVGTIMSNQTLALFLEKEHKQLLRTAVGDKYVAETLHRDNLLLGGEPSGHIIMNDYLSISDGIAVALSILEVIEQTDNNMLQTFDKFPQIHATIVIKEKKDLAQEPFLGIITKGEKKLLNGRLAVRYSGTEPYLRIMIEDSDQHYAQKLCHDLVKELQKEFSE